MDVADTVNDSEAVIVVEYNEFVTEGIVEVDTSGVRLVEFDDMVVMVVLGVKDVVVVRFVEVVFETGFVVVRELEKVAFVFSTLEVVVTVELAFVVRSVEVVLVELDSIFEVSRDVVAKESVVEEIWVVVFVVDVAASFTHLSISKRYWSGQHLCSETEYAFSSQHLKFSLS